MNDCAVSFPPMCGWYLLYMLLGQMAGIRSNLVTLWRRTYDSEWLFLCRRRLTIYYVSCFLLSLFLIMISKKVRYWRVPRVPRIPRKLATTTKIGNINRKVWNYPYLDVFCYYKIFWWIFLSIAFSTVTLDKDL